MSPESAIHIVRKKHLLSGTLPTTWQDPENIAVVEPPRLRTMLGNPLSESEEDICQFIATVDNRVVGRMDAYAGRLRIGENEVPMLWASNLFVPPEHRHTLMGVKLILQMQRMAPTAAVCGVSQIVKPIYEKLGWINFPMPRHILLRRSRPVVTRYVNNRLAAELATLGADVVLGIHRIAMRAANSVAGRRLTAVPVDALPANLHPLLAKTPCAFATYRSSAWIQWLYQHSFSEDARNRSGLFLIHDKSDKVVGYFLARLRFYPVATQRAFKNLTLGSLMDWAIFEPAAVDFRDIVTLAARVLSQWGADAVEICVPPDCDGSFLRRSRGFVRSGELSMMVKASPGSPLIGTEFRESRAWRMRPADGDNFLA